MSKISKKYPEVESITEDIHSLKDNTVKLGKHLKEDGAVKTEELKGMAAKQLEGFSAQGKEQLKKVEGRVQEKPLQSLAIAFVAGLATSIILGRK